MHILSDDPSIGQEKNPNNLFACLSSLLNGNAWRGWREPALPDWPGRGALLALLFTLDSRAATRGETIGVPEEWLARS